MADGTRPQVGVVGVGRAGGALARALVAAGYRVDVVWSRTRERAEQVGYEIGARVAATAIEAAGADLVILAVVDSQITPLAELIAEHAPSPSGALVVHLSGANGVEALAALTARGYRAGAFHPLQTFADPFSPILPGTLFAIEAEAAAFAVLATVARNLGGVPLHLAAENRAVYHAAATMAANYAVTLIDEAAGLLAKCGLPSEQALLALLPLLRGAVENLARLGLPDALTGPIARGDVATVARHLAALAERSPQTLPIYASLGRATVPIAAAQRGDHSQLAEMAALFEHAAVANMPD